MADKAKIKIGIPTFFFFSALVLFNCNISALMPFICALLHESGHLLAMKISKIKIKEIKILPFGIDIKKAPSVSSYKTDILISSAGVLTNVLLIILGRTLFKIPESNTFILSNYLLVLINVLPIKSLDGGQMLELLLLLKLSPETAEKIMSVLSLITLTLLGCIAIWLLINTSYNFTLLLMCMYLFCGIFLK